MEFEGNLNPIHGVRIHVIGVGGCGINAIEHMIASGLPGASFITADTNVAALARSQAEHTIQLGPTCCMGLGTNGDPNLGRRAAEESLPAIKAAIDGADMIFVVAGMGCGGTGTGAAPVIAKAAKDTGALTIGVVTKPFAFEGTKTLQRAEAGTQAFLYSVDSLIAIPNDSQLQFAPKKTPEILKKANEALYQALKCVSDMVTQGGLIGLDFAEVRAVLGGSGMIAIGIGTASSEHRAKTAAMRALDCSLLGDAHIGDLRGVLYSITASSADLSGDEIQKVATVIGDAVHEDADICFQVFCDNSMGDEMRVTLIGTFGTGMMTRQPGHSYSPLDGKLG
ncbi:MAG: cell division protein FtsZ [Betaproteobacteria bacterium]|nr:cell division protein FtsZ [Betaproteobacteria bacterium]